MLEVNRFENVLASLRVKKGWTQEDAAAHIGMSRSTYSALETGKLPPSENTQLAVFPEPLVYGPRGDA
jgi:transcriptional regulator with XRE-family HTH domain